MILRSLLLPVRLSALQARRLLRGHRAESALIVLVLAAGSGAAATTLVLTHAHARWLRVASDHPASRELAIAATGGDLLALAQLGTVAVPTGAGAGSDALELAQLERIAEQTPAVAAVYPSSFAHIDPPADGRGEDAITVREVGAAFPEAFGLELIAGRWPTAEEYRGRAPVLVLTADAARARFGERDPVGRRIGGRQREYRVVGVFEPGPGDRFFASRARPFGSAALAPYGAISGRDPARAARYHAMPLAGRRGEATAQLEAALASLAPVGVHVFPLLGAPAARRDRVALLLLAGFATLALLLATVNVANLLLARALRRTREAGLTAALGASRAVRASSALLDALLLALPGALGGVAVAAGLSRFIDLQLAAMENDLAFGLSPALAIATVAIALLTGVLFAAPATLHQLRLRPIEALRGAP